MFKGYCIFISLFLLSYYFFSLKVAPKIIKVNGGDI